MDRLALVEEIVKRMQDGTLTPSEGWASLKGVHQHMTLAEKMADECRAEIALEEHDETNFIDRL